MISLVNMIPDNIVTTPTPHTKVIFETSSSLVILYADNSVKN